MTLKLERQLIEGISADMEHMALVYHRIDDPADLAPHVVDIGQLLCLTALRVLELEERIEALEKNG